MHISSQISKWDYHASISLYFVKHIISRWHSSRRGMSEEQEMVGGGDGWEGEGGVG